MPQSIPKGLTRVAVLQALADLDAGIEHPFGAPTGYELVHEEHRYAPKAVIGLAYRSLLGRVLLPEEFSGGEASGQANYVLRELGFTIVRKGPVVTEEDPEASGRGRDWTPEEVDLVVADPPVFTCMGIQARGLAFAPPADRQRVAPARLRPGLFQERRSPVPDLRPDRARRSTPRS